ncbi:MAG: hypothetical protein WD544_02150, partial [Patescibacteria group bacterium]
KQTNKLDLVKTGSFLLPKNIYIDSGVPYIMSLDLDKKTLDRVKKAIHKAQNDMKVWRRKTRLTSKQRQRPLGPPRIFS